MIYAVRAAGTPYIKFGRANNVLRRLNEMETGCPHELEVLAAADWPDGAESGIHRYLKDCWHKREWFVESELTAQVIKWLMDSNGLEAFKAASPGDRRAAGHSEAVLGRKEQRRQWWTKNGESVHQG